MKLLFEELAYRQTPIGDLSLRRRTDPASGQDVYEVKLGDDFLMSSRYVDGEVALARLGLAATRPGPLDVVVGGLGLGYTARAVLEHPRVESLTVVDVLADVIDWHRQHVVPLGAGIVGDPRCSLVHGDFFALAADPESGFNPARPGRQFDAILLDIDHSPDNVLHRDNSALYTAGGLAGLAHHLRPGGVFALWSNGAAAAEFVDAMHQVFDDVAAHYVDVDTGKADVAARNVVYVGRRAP